MKTFKWSDSFLTGLDLIDEQHHQLLDLVNQFSDIMTNNKLEFEDINKIYNELVHYSVYHFSSEENFMEKMNLDMRYIQAHKLLHKSFIEDVVEIYSEITPDDLEGSKRLLKFLTYWLVYHILGNDKEMASQAKAIQSGVAPEKAYENLEKDKDATTAPLLDALNGLFEHLSLKNKELKKLNESLEEKVRIRTQELEEANTLLKTLSITDELTEIHNRRYTMHALDILWENSINNMKPLVCIMFDVDHFKEINDTYGHDVGDLVLKEIARTLKESFRNDDIVGRLGGDEFFVICPNTQREGGRHIAEKARKAISEIEIPVEDTSFTLSMSVGVGYLNSEMKTPKDIIKAADNGMYMAKEAGKNCVKVYKN
jgi:hemerythrin